MYELMQITPSRHVGYATEQMFLTPAKKETADYIEGRYG